MALLTAPTPGLDPDRILRIGRLEVNVPNMSMRVGDQKVTLPLREFQVLVLLADHAGKVVLTSTIVDHVWGPSYKDPRASLKAHIRKLRRRLYDVLDADYIRTVRSVGYVLEPPTPSAADGDVVRLDGTPR